MVYARSGRSWQSIFQAESATRPFPCPTTSATLGGPGAIHHLRRISVDRSVGRALIYPIAVPAVCFLICLFVMPETRHNRIWGPAKALLLARDSVVSGRGECT